MNKVILVGRMVADPELKTTQSGISLCSFRIACDRRYSSQSGERQADFINCVAWRTQAEFVSKYFNKGKLIGIDGSLQTRQYEDQQGNKRTAYEVVCDNISFVGGKSESSGGGFDMPPVSRAPAAAVAYQSGGVDDFQEITDDEDLPF